MSGPSGSFTHSPGGKRVIDKGIHPCLDIHMKAYNILRSAILTVAIAGAGYTVAGGFDVSPPLPSIQHGTVIQGDTPLDSFTESASLDTSQVEAR